MNKVKIFVLLQIANYDLKITNYVEFQVGLIINAIAINV